MLMLQFSIRFSCCAWCLALHCLGESQSHRTMDQEARSEFPHPNFHQSRTAASPSTGHLWLYLVECWKPPRILQVLGKLS